MIRAAHLRVSTITAIISCASLSWNLTRAAEIYPELGFQKDRLVVAKPVEDESVEQVVIKDLDGDGVEEYVVAVETNASTRRNPSAEREVGDVLASLLIGHREGDTFKPIGQFRLGEPETGGALKDLAVLDVDRDGTYEIIVHSVLGAHTAHLLVLSAKNSEIQSLWETSSPGGISWGFDPKGEFRVAVSRSPHVPESPSWDVGADVYVFREGKFVQVDKIDPNDPLEIR